MNWQPRASFVTRAAASVLLAAASCAAGSDDGSPTTGSTAATTDSTATAATVAAGPAPSTSAPAPRPVVVSLRLEDRTGTEPGFAAAVRAILTDPRGWQRAGIAFAFDDGPAAPYVVVLAEADEVDALCAPYDTVGRYSCQLGPVVALNADRWRTATPEWPADLASYREMLVNHEVGHLLGLHHPDPQCPAAGEPAPVMAQQSTELPGTGCLPNPWPLDHEVACAAALPPSEQAPPYEPDPEPACA